MDKNNLKIKKINGLRVQDKGFAVIRVTYSTEDGSIKYINLSKNVKSKEYPSYGIISSVDSLKTAHFKTSTQAEMEKLNNPDQHIFIHAARDIKQLLARIREGGEINLDTD